MSGMFFEKESFSFHILDVLELKQRQVSTRNSGRNFSALSFRLRADAVLRTRTGAHRMTDHSVAYVPARLDYDRVAEVDEMIVVHFEAIDYSTHEIETFTPRDPERLQVLFERIRDLWEQRAVGYRHRCAAVLCEILAECYVQNFVAEQKPSRIRRSVDYLQAHFRQSDLTVGALAERSFMSEVYFRKLFREEFGISPQRYLIELRIRHAVGLISTGYYSLKEVADLSGYRDYKYFSTEFKRIMGVSPSEYRYRYG